MVSEKDFLKFVKKVNLNTKALEKLDDAIGLNIWESNFSCLAANSDFIASLLMEIKPCYYETFCLDYWNMIYNDKSNLKIYDKDCIEIKRDCLYSWPDFYRYWKQIIENAEER